MRRRRPTRLRTRIDREATAAMEFRSKDSYVALDGRHVYYGEDAAAAYVKAHRVWVAEGRKCGFCQMDVRAGDEHWHHVRSKGRHLRDDHPRNRAFVHTLCHEKIHGREPRFYEKNVPAV